MENCCDMILCSSDGRLFKVHSKIISSSSSLIRNFLDKRRQMYANKVKYYLLKLKGLPASVVQVTLNFIYGTTPLTMSDFKLLQHGADKLGISDGVRFCRSEVNDLCRIYHKVSGDDLDHSNSDDDTSVSIQDFSLNPTSLCNNPETSDPISEALYHANLQELDNIGGNNEQGSPHAKFEDSRNYKKVEDMQSSLPEDTNVRFNNSIDENSFQTPGVDMHIQTLNTTELSNIQITNENIKPQETSQLHKGESNSEFQHHSNTNFQNTESEYQHVHITKTFQRLLESVHEDSSDILENKEQVNYSSDVSTKEHGNATCVEWITPANNSPQISDQSNFDEITNHSILSNDHHNREAIATYSKISPIDNGIVSPGSNDFSKEQGLNKEHSNKEITTSTDCFLNSSIGQQFSHNISGNGASKERTDHDMVKHTETGTNQNSTYNEATNPRAIQKLDTTFMQTDSNIFDQCGINSLPKSLSIDSNHNVDTDGNFLASIIVKDYSESQDSNKVNCNNNNIIEHDLFKCQSGQSIVDLGNSAEEICVQITSNDQNDATFNSEQDNGGGRLKTFTNLTPINNSQVSESDMINKFMTGDNSNPTQQPNCSNSTISQYYDFLKSSVADFEKNMTCGSFPSVAALESDVTFSVADNDISDEDEETHNEASVKDQLKQRRRPAKELLRQKSSSDQQVCEECGEICLTIHALRRHQLKVHKKGELFPCPHCPFKTPRKKDILSHLLSQHGLVPPNTKVYTCSHCSYRCVDKCRFYEHQATHSRNKTFQCDSCEKSFTTKRGLRNHQLYHSDERPFSCDTCQASFKVKSKLRDHIRLIHVQKGEKPFKCGYCDFHAAVRGNVNQHIRHVHKQQNIKVVDTKIKQRRFVKNYDYENITGNDIESKNVFE